MRKPTVAALLPLSLPLLLAACNSSGGPQADRLDGFARLSLQTSLASGAAIQTQGIPFRGDGSPAVQSVRVRVFDDKARLIRFDNRNMADPAGDREFVELTPGAATADVRLRPGTYSFQASGLTRSRGGTLLAFGRIENRAVNSAEAETLYLPLRTLVGNVTLESALPVTSLVYGQQLDLLLTVETPEADGQRYTVPLSDFNASYGIDPRMGTILKKSDLGTRVIADTAQANQAQNFVVRAGLDGLVEAEEDVASSQTFRAVFSRPFYSALTLGADLERPGLTAGGFAQDQGRALISGRVSDNVGVAKVQVYEGPVLIGSSDEDEYGRAGVEQVRFRNRPDDNGTAPNWLFDWTTPREGDFTLTVLARDTSGNETRVVRNVTLIEAPAE